MASLSTRGPCSLLLGSVKPDLHRYLFGGQDRNHHYRDNRTFTEYVLCRVWICTLPWPYTNCLSWFVFILWRKKERHREGH